MSAETDLQAAIGRYVKIPNEYEKFLVSNTPNYGSLESSAQTSIPVDTMPGPMEALAAWRAGLYGLPGLVAGGIASYLPAYARIIGIPDRDIPGILFQLWKRFNTSSLSVKSRAFSFGTPSAGGSNSGTGVLTRLTTDEYGFKIESGSPEAKSWKCTDDEHSANGARHRELFEYRGAAIGQNALPFPGQGGIVSGIPVMGINDPTSRYIQNSGFEQYDATNGFAGWTAGTPANVSQSTTSPYQDVPFATAASAEFTASTYLQQSFTERLIRWDPTVPLYAQLAWKRKASATGTLALTIGSKTASVSLASGTNNVWNILRWPGTTPGQTAWFSQWNAQDALVKIDVSSLAVGTVEVDALICGPYTRLDGTWYALVGGATPFLRDDVFTYTDTATEAAILQKWFTRAFPGFYLPSKTDGSETWADPT